MSSLGSVIGILGSEYLPGATNPIIKAAIGSQLGYICESLALRLGEKARKVYESLTSSGVYKVTITKFDDNAIFQKIEKYIVTKHVENIRAAPVVPLNGEIVFSLANGQFIKPLIEVYQGHEVVLEIDTREAKDKDKDASENVIIKSYTAGVDILRQYVESICQFKLDSRMIKVFRPIVEGKKKGEPGSVRWSEFSVISNKRISNTIVSETVQKNLFDDIASFMKNEEWYNARGISYNRGYLLHGEPGTGKTSSIKAIANEHQLDIFSIQMDTITDNNHFSKLLSEINYHISSNKPYIIVLSDIDRCDMFKRYHDSRGVTISVLLNELDGVVETYGRILFITANNTASLTMNDESKALFRPGRIDKQVYLTYCDKDQLERLSEKFTGEMIKIPNNTVIKNITPASVINVFQEHIDSPEKLIELIEKPNFYSEVEKRAVEQQQVLNVGKKRTRTSANDQVAKKRKTLRSAKKRLRCYIKDSQKVDIQEERIKKYDEQLNNAIERRKKAKAAKAKATKKKVVKRKVLN